MKESPAYHPPANLSTQGGGPGPVIVTSYPTSPIAMVPFGPNPQMAVCPSCHSQATTRVTAESSTKTHLMAALLCLACCCCIPYFVDSCKNRNHYCKSCGAYLGSYN